MTNAPKKNILVFRLSSLGDLILSLAYLESLPKQAHVDWVTSKEFEFIFSNHPRIRKLFLFDKKSGFAGWIALLKETAQNKYHERVDLHATIRTQVARVYLFLLDLSRFQLTKWRSVSKQRIRTALYLFFKELLPRFLRPTRYWKRFAKLANTPNLNPPSYQFAVKDGVLQKLNLTPKKYIALMPASRWSSKEWETEKYLKLLQWLSQNTPFQIVLLGRSSDLACADLAEELLQKSIPYTSMLDEKDFSVTASVIAGAYCFLGSDTGLAHLAEAVGTPAWVIFGPTRPDLGFGPRMPESKSLTASVFCSPCSKDGRVCARFWEPYACLKRLTPEEVQKHFQGVKT